MTQSTILDLDALLDSTLDNVPDVPDYMNPPAGQYRLGVEDAAIEKMKAKEGEVGGSRIKITYKVVATKETKEMPVPDGTLFTETFMGTEQGLGFFKRQVKKIMNTEEVGGVSLRDLVSGLKGTEFDAIITTRTTSSNGKTYENINVRPVHEA